MVNCVLLEERVQGFGASVEGFLQILKDQFADPYLCFRELLQNAVDEDPNQIDVRTKYDSKQRIFAVEVEDDGNGMDLEKIKTYLTLFDSTKDDLTNKIGKFGIGKVSAFVLDPDYIVVETGTEREGYKLAFNKDASGKIIETSSRKGTKATLVFKDLDYEEAEFKSIKIQEILSKSCQYIKKPLYFNSSRINREFALGKTVEQKYVVDDENGGTIECVLAIGDKREVYLKGGILLEDRRAFGRGVREKLFGNSRMEALVNSTLFNHPLSRNKVYVDKNFFNIIELLRKPYDRFNEYCIDLLKESKDPQLSNLLTLYLLEALSQGKKHPEKLDNAKVIASATGEKVSRRDISSFYEANGFVYVTEREEGKDNLDYFVRSKIPVIRIYKDSDEGRLISDIMLQFDSKRFIEVSYQPNQIKRTYLSPYEVRFLDYAAATISKVESETADYYNRRKKKVYFGRFSDLAGRPLEWKMYDIQKKKIVINLNNSYVNSMLEFSRSDMNLATFYLASEFIQIEDCEDKEDYLTDFSLDFVSQMGVKDD